MGISRVCYPNFVSTDSTQVVVLFFGNTVQSRSMKVMVRRFVTSIQQCTMYLDISSRLSFFFFFYISLFLLLLQSLMLR